MKDLTLKHKFISLRSKDISIENVCKEIGISKSTGIYWNKEYQSLINRIRAINIDTIYEEAFINKQIKLKAYSKILNKIYNELITKDYSKLPIPILIDKFLVLIEKVENISLHTVFNESNDYYIYKKEDEFDNELSNLVNNDDMFSDKFYTEKLILDILENEPDNQQAIKEELKYLKKLYSIDNEDEWKKLKEDRLNRMV